MIDTINTISKSVAESMGISEQLAKKVYAYYWKSVKGHIASGQHTSLWLKHIGTLTVSRTKVNKIIKKLIKRVRDLKADKVSYPRKTKEQIMIEALTDLRILCARRNEIAIAYRANEDRLKLKHEAKTKGHMGVETPDITGDCESPI